MHEYLQLNEYQELVVKHFQSLAPEEPFLPWQRQASIQGGGIFAVGWTKDDYILMV